MKKFILCFFMLIAASSVSWADAVTFEATVDSPRVSLDQAMQLTLTVTGVNQDLDPISLPVLDGFSAKYMGPSSSVSFVNVNGNAQSHSEKSFIYELFPNKTGHFQIPAITANIIGQTYTTKPIDVEVVEGSAQAQPSGGATDQNQVPTAESLKDKVLIMVTVDKTQVYLNERVPVSIKLLVNDVTMRDIQFPQFDKSGFTVDDFEKPVQSSQVINGVRYDTVEFKTNIYPGHLGDMAVGPVQIQGNILYKTGQSNPFNNQENDIFGANVFNNLFDSYASRPVTATSQPVLLHVSPLPSQNIPDDFSGAIGQFDFQASVSPLQVKAGDPLTLKMGISGSGNFKSLKMPVFKNPEFKTYEPQVKDTGDQKTAEEVIIPTWSGIKEVPALRFSYFDTSINDYKTITQGPFPVQVIAPSPDQEFKAIGFTDVSREPVLPADQFSFGKIISMVRQVLEKLFRSILFWLSAGFILVAGVAYFLWRGYQDRLVNDPAFARRLKAVREARQALGAAESYISAGKSKDLYALISRVLRDYLANKWHQSAAALSVEEILRNLKTAKADEALILQVKTLLELSDLVCFAGTNRDAGQMRTDLSQVRDLIAHLEKSLK